MRIEMKSEQKRCRRITCRLLILLVPAIQPLAVSQLSNAQRVTEPSAKPSYKVLYSFKNSPDGANPWADLIRDSAGALYGTTYLGGADNGTVFKLDRDDKESVLFSFPNDLLGAAGQTPFASLVMDHSGNLYGTTAAGGASGNGTVFKISKNGVETVLYSFQGSPDGQLPASGLLRDAAGNLFGTTAGGGASGNGTVFQLDPSGKETVLYSFAGGSDGSAPYGNLIQDSAGNLYGTTSAGGGSGCYDHQGCGSVFKLDKTGKETVLHKFSGGKDGSTPYAGLIRDAAGNLYGITSVGGAFGHGVVFRLDKNGRETVLYAFTGGVDGDGPGYGSLVQDANGSLFGTTGGGGAFSKGIVFRLDTTGKETVLHSFAGGSDGANPTAGLIRDTTGNFYGTTLSGGDAAGDGVVFKLTP
jgi:uncharacterized repeat protein (TIGR03803 family)